MAAAALSPLALLAILVSVCALAAIVSIAPSTGWPHRLTFIGWDIINIGILLLLLVKQMPEGEQPAAGHALHLLSLPCSTWSGRCSVATVLLLLRACRWPVCWPGSSRSRTMSRVPGARHDARAHVYRLDNEATS